MRLAGLVRAQVRDCTLCRECIREPDMAKKLRLARKKDHFIFTIESTGILPAPELFKQSGVYSWGWLGMGACPACMCCDLKEVGSKGAGTRELVGRGFRGSGLASNTMQSVCVHARNSYCCSLTILRGRMSACTVLILRAKATKMLDLLEQLEGELAVQAMDEDSDDVES